MRKGSIKFISAIAILLLISSVSALAQKRTIEIDGYVEEIKPFFNKHKKILRNDFDHSPLDHVKIEVFDDSGELLTKAYSIKNGNYSIVFDLVVDKIYRIKFSKKGVYPKTFEYHTEGLVDGDMITLLHRDVHLHKEVIGLSAPFFKKPYEKHVYLLKKDIFHADEKYDAGFYDHIDNFLSQMESRYQNSSLKYVKMDKSTTDDSDIKAKQLLSQAEKDAQKIIKTAREEAKEIIITAENEISKRSNKLVAKAQKEADEILSLAKDEAFEQNDGLKKHMDAAKNEERKKVLDSVSLAISQAYKQNSSLKAKSKASKKLKQKVIIKKEYIEDKKAELLAKLKQLEIDKLKAKNNEDSTKIHESEIAILAIQNDIELTENQIAAAQKEIILKDELVNKQKFAIIVSILALCIALVSAFFFYKNLKTKQKTNIILERQNKEIKEKNEYILSSITYAKRIQTAILPPKVNIEEALPDSFFLYNPKEIVSGDFYWLQNKGGKKLFAAVDCTGHGVPGAFMSIVGHNALNRAVREKKLTKPSEILDEINNTLEETLSQDTENLAIRDGMDLALCALDENTMKLEYAGAYNPLWIVRDGKLLEFKADKKPIGHSIEKLIDGYTNHTVDLQKGDSIYIFSDGYVDQFGGAKGLKFMRRRLKEYLVSIATEDMANQHKLLLDNFNMWKGELDQLDDICVIGVRV